MPDLTGLLGVGVCQGACPRGPGPLLATKCCPLSQPRPACRKHLRHCAAHSSGPPRSSAHHVSGLTREAGCTQTIRPYSMASTRLQHCCRSSHWLLFWPAHTIQALLVGLEDSSTNNEIRTDHPAITCMEAMCECNALGKEVTESIRAPLRYSLTDRHSPSFSRVHNKEQILL